MSEQKHHPWYHMGRRFAVASFAALILVCSLIDVRTSYEDKRNTTAVDIEIRHQPNLLLGAIAIYLLGIATDFNLALPLKALTGNSAKRDDA